MKKRQNALVAVTAAAALFTLTACGGGGTATTAEGAEFSEEYSGTLTAWGFQEPDEVAQSRIDLADDKLAESDTEVDLDNSQFDAQKFTTLAASGNIPDVVLMDRQFVTTYASQGLIMPIDDCFALYDIDPREYWYPQVVDDVTWDDQVWAVPQFYQPPAILLNMRVMGETGVTPENLNVSDQDAFLSAVEKMTVMNGQNPARLGFDPQGPAKAGLWMLSFGGSTIGEDGEPTLDNPKNAEAIDFLKKIYDLQGGYANVKSFVDSFDVFGENNSYVADQVGAAIFDQWYVNVLTSYAEQVEIGATPILTQEGEPFTVASGTSLVIPTASKNPSAACDWALTLTSLEAWEAAGAARAETTEADPGRNGINAGLFTGSPEADQTIREAYVMETGYAGFDQTIATYYDVASSGASFGSSPAGQQIQSELQNAVTSALLGEKSAADALADAQSAAQRAFDQVAG